MAAGEKIKMKEHRKNGKGSEFKSNQEGDPTFHFQEYWEGRHKNKLESLEATLVQNRESWDGKTKSDA